MFGILGASVLIGGRQVNASDPTVAVWARYAVAALNRAQLMMGYPDGRFRGAEYVRRHDTVLVFARLLQGRGAASKELLRGEADSLLATFSPRYMASLPGEMFKDVDAGHWYYSYTYDPLIRRDVINGYPDGYYRRKWLLTRADLAAIAARTLLQFGRRPLNLDHSRFRDVAGDEWYFGPALVAAGSGVMTGYADGTFRPHARATRNEMAVVAARLLSYLKAETGTDGH